MYIKIILFLIINLLHYLSPSESNNYTTPRHHHRSWEEYVCALLAETETETNMIFQSTKFHDYSIFH